jgi:2-keto-myo-inositol isomerase
VRATEQGVLNDLNALIGYLHTVGGKYICLQKIGVIEMGDARIFPFQTALNASTLFPFKLSVPEQVRVAAEAGFAGIELWVNQLDAYLAGGGTLPELRAVIADADIALVNAIAFFPWADANDATRERGFAQAEREMHMLAELGCVAVAAPPFGNVEGVSLTTMASHFAQLAELARGIGVEPYLEFWGRAHTLSRLSEALYVAMESGLPDAKLLLDPFHMYTGGSELTSLAYLNGANIGIVHANDYPAAPARAQISDAERVFPSAGVAPTHAFASLLYRAGYHGYLSLELFREDYEGQSALEVARRGLDAMQTAYTVAG